MIIGLAGAKRSGKNYVGNALLDSISEEYMTTSGKTLNTLQGWGIRSFADPLRAFVLDVFSMDDRHSDGYLKEVKVRSVMPTHEHIKAACSHYFGDTRPAKLISQYLTTNQEQYKFINKSYRELMTYIGTELIRDGISPDFWVDIANTKYANSNVIITDVRMANEAKWVRDNGVLIHICNPNIKYTGDHSTELGVDKLDQDLVFFNDPNESLRIFNSRLNGLKGYIKNKLLRGSDYE